MLWLDHLLQDTRFALRALRKSPLFTLIAILTLTLGIGANTAMFSVVNSVLFRSLPFRQASDLVYLSNRSTLFDFPYLGLSFRDIAEVRSASSLLGLAVCQDSPKEVIKDGMAQRLESSEVTEDFFPLLGLRPLYGRGFTSADMQRNVRFVILSYEFWRDSFGSDPFVVGKSIALDGQPHTIIGVMPPQPRLGFFTDSKLWIPFVPTPEQLSDHGNHTYAVISRLKPHASIAQAQAELDTISAHLASAYPDTNKGWRMHVTPLKKFLLGDAQAPLAILFCAVGFVLLIACANVSNLFLARGSARRREFAIRAALGAPRSALLRQLAVEALLIALVSGACAFLVSIWTTQFLRSALPPDIPRLDQLRADTAVAGFTLAAALVSALLFSVAPALLTTARGLSLGLLRQTANAGSAAGHHFLRQLLVVGEISLAAVLLIGATLALRSFRELLHRDLGFRPDRVLTLRLDFPKFRFATTGAAITFLQQVLDTTRAVPEVSSASAGLVFPMSDELAETTFITEALATDPKREQQSASANRVAPGFFRTLGIPLLAGREFADSDTQGTSPVFIVSARLAEKYFGTLDVVGKRFSTDFAAGLPVWGQIVGVVGDVQEASLQAELKPQVYAPFFQTPRLIGVYLLVHSDSDPLRLVPVLQERIWSIDKNQPVTSVATLHQRIAEVNASPRSQTILLGMLAALGLLLALIGVYGVMSYLVSLQTREIGIRMALGAAPSQVLRRILAHGLKLALTGVLLGLLGGLLLTRFMSSLLFGISSADPLTYTTVAILFTFVALTASYLPARRAARLDPMVVLRDE